MRPGNFWSYLLICAVALAVAHTKALPIGQQVAAVFQEVVDGFQGKTSDGATVTTSGSDTYLIRR